MPRPRFVLRRLGRSALPLLPSFLLCAILFPILRFTSGFVSVDPQRVAFRLTHAELASELPDPGRSRQLRDLDLEPLPFVLDPTELLRPVRRPWRQAPRRPCAGRRSPASTARAPRRASQTGAGGRRPSCAARAPATFAGRALGAGHAGSVGSVALYLRCGAAISHRPPTARPSLSPPAAGRRRCAGSPQPRARKAS